MDNIGLNPIFFNQKISQQMEHVNSPHKTSEQFSKVLNDAIHKVNEAELTSNLETQKLMTGEKTDLHHVMITAEKASVSLLVTLEIRNKIIEAYQEVMRMPL